MRKKSELTLISERVAESYGRCEHPHCNRIMYDPLYKMCGHHRRMTENADEIKRRQQAGRAETNQLIKAFNNNKYLRKPKNKWTKI
jgi:hypothetical protein